MKRFMILLAAVICLAVLTACDNANKPNSENASASDTAGIPIPTPISGQSTEDGGTRTTTDSIDTPTSDLQSGNETDSQSFYSIETPFAVLRAPAEFETEVKTDVLSQKPYVLAFSTKDDVALFQIHVNEETNDLLGTLKTEKGTDVLYASFAKIDVNDEQYEQYTKYQLGISTIIENLTKDYGFLANELPADSKTDTFDIETSVVTLKYPLKWKDLVNIEVTDSAVHFTYQDEKLFDMVFFEAENTDGAYLLGTYDETPIYIVSYSVDESSFSEEELSNYNAMQANVNVILENLEKEEKFEING